MQHHEGVGALDEDLLAALDDVLSFDSSSISDAFTTTDSSTLGDEFDAMLSIEIPTPKASATTDQTLAEQPTKASTLSRSGSGKAPKPTSSQPAKKGKDVRAAPYSTAAKPRRRKRPKDELDYLRAKVADMEEELETLQKNPEVGSPAAVSAADVIYNGDQSGGQCTSPSVLLCWKKIADRQKKEAERSVVENMRLRSMLEGQLNVARSLEAAIDQHQRKVAQSLPNFENSDGSLPQPTEMTEDVIFSLLDESLEEQYTEIDTVFELNGLAHVNHDMNNGTKAHHDANGLSVRHEEVRLLPFSKESVHQAMWGILRYSTAKEMMLGPIHTQVVDDNRMNVTLIEKIELNKSRATNIIRRFSFRRVFEKDRIVLVWSSYVEMDGSVFVRLREKGYCTASSFNFGSNGGVPGSVTRFAITACPEMTAFASAEEHIGEITELVVGTYKVSMGLMHQIIDTLLLREAMGGSISGESVASPVVS
ncbi:hypothetical protein V7S43_010843 [Phytophthora oleae]|uniref:M96 mating-specific protein family n=1 Tax=Phytophthora oleae TaxID=2107226 RepID=A0ABD3FEM6_9STRA